MQTTATPALVRSKPRRRRWLFVVGFVLFLLATPFLYLLLSSRWRDHELEQIYAAMDAEDPHWRWADLVKQLPPAPPDERNAIVQLQKVVGIMKPTPFTSPFGNKQPTPINARLTDAQSQRLRAALAALAQMTLEEARKLKDMPEGQIKIDPSKSPLEPKHDCLDVLKITRMLKHQAMLNAHDGKIDDAAEACLAIVRSAHTIGDSPSLMPQLVRSAAQVDAVEALERILAQGAVEEERLEAIQRALRVEADHNGAYHAVRGERAFGHHLYLAIRDGDPSGQKIIDEIARQFGHQGNLYSIFPGLLLRSYPDRLRMLNAMISAVQLQDEAQVEALDKLHVKKPDIVNPLNNGVIFLQSNLGEHRMDHTRVKCAAAAVAAERYRLKYDQWPANLADLLKDDLLKSTITDPYDGQPLRFRRTDTGLLVYSIGPDKIDNRGKKDDIGFELWLPRYRAIAPPPDVEAPKK